METTAGALVLCLLAAIAAWVTRTQFDFNPLLLQELAPAGSPPAPAAETPAPADAQADRLAPAAAAETFNTDTLAEKINGRADLYLTSGFQSLETRRYAYPDRPELWVEMFVYDMDILRQAFAVYAIQRRADARAIEDLGDFAYATSDGLFVVHGRYYLEFIPSQESERLAGDIERLARQFVETTERRPEVIPELDLLPTQHMVPGSLMLQMANGFGYESFSNLVSAAYRFDDKELTGFALERASAADAEALAKAYADFLLANGGTEETVNSEIPGARMINVYGSYEVFFVRGRLFAGVHQAEDRDAAELLAYFLGEQLEAEP